MAQVALDLDPDDRRRFRRVLAFSAALHVLLFAALAFVPSLPRVSSPAAIAVNLVAAPARPAASAPAAAAPARPKPPKDAPVVLPKEAATPAGAR